MWRILLTFSFILIANVIIKQPVRQIVKAEFYHKLRTKRTNNSKDQIYSHRTKTKGMKKKAF